MDDGAERAPLITFVAVAYQRPRAIPVLVTSLLAQTDERWELIVIHDGPDKEHRQIWDCVDDLIVGGYGVGEACKIAYLQTDERLGQFGHPLRDIGIQQARAPWICLTNDDNYYMPTFVETVLARGETEPKPSVVACNMIHNHERNDYAGYKPPKRYGLLEVRPQKCFIDIGCFIARTELARSGELSLAVPLAANEKPGLWIVRVRDVLTGVAGGTQVLVAAP